MSALVKASTFSKDPSAWGFEPGLAVQFGSGAYLLLSDQRLYLDWVSGLGTNLLGYEVLKVGGQSISPSLPYYLEYSVADKLADMLAQHVPGWSSGTLGVRWCKAGSEATIMATRLARAITGNGWIVTFTGHYHGWGDTFIARTEPALGLPEDDRKTWAGVGDMPWGSISAFEAIEKWGDIAAVIFEHPAVDADPEWYHFLRKWCNEHGALLIADEVVTGLRYGLGGACERYGIRPDLICLGKSLGNGAPIGALVGPKEYMDWFAKDSPVFCSSTTWGESHGLRMADEVLEIWDETKVEGLWLVGDILISGLKKAGWDAFGHGARSVLRFKDEYERAWFIHGMRERFILMNRPNFPSLSHTVDHVSETVKAAAEVRKDIKILDRVKSGELALPKVLFKDR